MKNSVILILLLHGSMLFGQVRFENKKLALLNDIFYNTTKESIDSFMKEKGFEKVGVERENEGDITEIYAFTSRFDSVDVYFTKGNKVFAVNCIYDGAPNNIVIGGELLGKGFTAVTEEENFDGVTVAKKVWSKAGSKLKFVTSVDEKEKIGVVGFGNYQE